MRLPLRPCNILLGISILSSTTLLAGAAETTSIKGWSVRSSVMEKYEAGIDPSSVHEGKPTAFLQSRPGNTKIDDLVAMVQKISPEHYYGKRVKLSAWLRSQDVKDAGGLMLRVDGPDGKILGFDNMENRPVKGTTDWKEYSCVLDVPTEAEKIVFGFLLYDTGKIWASNFQLQPASKDIPTTNLLPSETKKLNAEPVNMDFSEK